MNARKGGRRSKLNADLKHESVRVHRSGSTAKEGEPGYVGGINASDFSSINKSTVPDYAQTSLQSVVHPGQKQLEDSMNMPFIVDP